MRISIFYFSGTGNTKWAVNEFSNGVNMRKHECQVYSIEDKGADIKKVVGEADIIGFAFPVYGASMPKIMTSFIDNLKSVSNAESRKPFFIITTAGFIDAFGPFAARRILNQSGLDLIGYINIVLSNNISTPKLKANFITSEELGKRMNKGKEKIEKLVDKLIQGRKHVQNIGFYLLPGVLIRKASKKALEENYLALSVDKERCCKCMLCVNNCPAKSIVFSDKDVKFLPSCTACMRCYNFCPKNAICHDGKYADPDIYKRYKGPTY